MREQRAFAAVSKGGSIDLNTIAGTHRRASNKAGSLIPGNWPEAKRRGWRIRPVLIRVEDNGGKDD